MKQSNKSINNELFINNNEFDILFNNFLVKLSNDNQASFVLYVFNNDKVKKFIFDHFDGFLIEFSVNKYWFFKNALYLYCFRNNKNDFVKLPMEDIFNVFFEQFSQKQESVDYDYPDLDKI